MTRPPEITNLHTRRMDRAACAQWPDLLWLGGVQPDRSEVDAMRRICAACPVRTACQRFADDAGACAGWWAGRSYNRGGPSKPLRPQPGEAA